MQLKTFSALSSGEVLAMIRAELGPDAVILDTKEKNGRVVMTAALERDLPASNGEKNSPPGWTSWHEEWDTIRHHLLALAGPALKLDELPPRQRVAVEFLQRQGLDNAASMALVSQLRNKPESNILEPLSDMVPIKSFNSKSWAQKIHIFSGPFGVGKTSVTIRLALKARRENPDAKICLINADATRGNGRLFLKHYSELSDFSYKDATNAMELLGAVAKAEKEGFDKIFIDLPGLGRDENLEDFLQSSGFGEDEIRATGVAVHLVLPPMYGEMEFRSILRRYRTSIPGSIIWTKLDEAEHYGALINVAVQTNLPVSALSYGPGMGNSISMAKGSSLWKIIFKNELPDG